MKNCDMNNPPGPRRLAGFLMGKALLMDNKSAVEKAEGRGVKMDTSMRAGGREVGHKEPERYHGGKHDMGAAVRHLDKTPAVTNPDTTAPHRGKMSR